MEAVLFPRFTRTPNRIMLGEGTETFVCWFLLLEDFNGDLMTGASWKLIFILIQKFSMYSDVRRTERLASCLMQETGSWEPDQSRCVHAFSSRGLPFGPISSRNSHQGHLTPLLHPFIWEPVTKCMQVKNGSFPCGD
jgi:hypothetical protein